MVQKVAINREFEAGLCNATTGKISLVNPAVNGYLFQIREGLGSERRGMGFAFHQLCPRYSGTLTPTASTAVMLWETVTLSILTRTNLQHNHYHQQYGSLYSCLTLFQLNYIINKNSKTRGQTV